MHGWKREAENKQKGTSRGVLTDGGTCRTSQGDETTTQAGLISSA